MPVTNSDVSTIFQRMADLLEIQGENVFRIRAYRNAAHTIDGLGESVATMVGRGEDLSELPGIGKDLAGKITEIVASGHLAALDRLARRVPGQLAEMMQLPALGPKRVAALHEKLGIRTLAQLEAACRSGKLRQVPGIGDKTVARVLDALERWKAAPKRTRIDVAEQVVEPLLAWLRGAPEVRECMVAGSLRRRCETVGDIDVLVCTATEDEGPAVVERLAAYDNVREVLARGPTRGTVVLRSGMQVDIRAVPKRSWGAALLYLTGSKAHNIAVRRLALARGRKINEYGVFRGDRFLVGETEAAVYEQVGLPFLEPELRENRGEIEAAAHGELPHLLRRSDLQGDLHAHTDASDGASTLEEMADAAREAGYSYLAITDHTASLRLAHGLDARRLGRQLERIDRLNERLDGFTVLKSAEIDILEDGSLDLPDSLLSELDLAVCAIHSHFMLSAAAQTRRVLTAMDNPWFDLFAHPTGRLIGERLGYQIDMETVMQGAVERGCFLELNSQPERLDANDVTCRRARELGLKVAISTDAHGCGDLDKIRYGVDQARRAWLGPDDVLNTRSWKELRKLLRRSRGLGCQ